MKAQDTVDLVIEKLQELHPEREYAKVHSQELVYNGINHLMRTVAGHVTGINDIIDELSKYKKGALLYSIEMDLDNNVIIRFSDLRATKEEAYVNSLRLEQQILQSNILNLVEFMESQKSQSHLDSALLIQRNAMEIYNLILEKRLHSCRVKL